MDKVSSHLEAQGRIMKVSWILCYLKAKIPRNFQNIMVRRHFVFSLVSMVNKQTKSDKMYLFWEWRISLQSKVLGTHLKQKNSNRTPFLPKEVWNITMFWTFAAIYSAVGYLYVNDLVQFCCQHLSILTVVWLK